MRLPHGNKKNGKFVLTPYDIIWHHSNMRRIRTNIYLEPKQKKLLDSLCEATGIRLTEFVRRALDEYIEKYIATHHEELRNWRRP